MTRLFINIGMAGLLCYGLLLLVVYFRQDGMLYFPDKEVLQTPGSIQLEYSEIAFRTRDGIVISGWYIPAEDEKGVLLFCHGNAGNISHRLDSLRIFRDLNLSVLIFDYRGYGKSEGTPSEEGTYQDAEAAWDYLLSEKAKAPQRIVLFGRSLGGAVAAEIARRKHPGALIIESSFTSVPDLAQRMYPWLPVRLLSKFSYATIDKVGVISCPKLVISSPDDEIVPFVQSEELYRRASEPKEFLKIRGSHNEGFLVSGKVYSEGLRMFLGKYLYK